MPRPGFSVELVPDGRGTTWKWTYVWACKPNWGQISGYVKADVKSTTDDIENRAWAACWRAMNDMHADAALTSADQFLR